MFNKVMLGGVIDSEIKRAKTAKGTDITSFRLKTSAIRKYDSQSAENQSGNPQYQQYANQWHNITAFGGQYGDLCTGEFAVVEGALNTRSYHCPNSNTKKYTTGVNASSIYKWNDDKKCVVGGCTKNDKAKNSRDDSSVGKTQPEKDPLSSDPSFDDIPF